MVEIFGDSIALARAAANHVLKQCHESVAQHGRFNVALSGGSTPQTLYKLLADEPIPWAKSHFFFTDERHVPPDHPQSNYRLAHEAMFSRAPVPEQNVQRIPGETPSAAAAAHAYEQTLRTHFGATLPRFELVLLGLGEDGHTASIFPRSEVLHETERLVAAPWVEQLNSYRITLTLPVLNNGASVVFLVSGEQKAEVLREVLQTESNPARYPAQAIRPNSGNLLWLVDQAAARLLR